MTRFKYRLLCDTVCGGDCKSNCIDHLIRCPDCQEKYSLHTNRESFSCVVCGTVGEFVYARRTFAQTAHLHCGFGLCKECYENLVKSKMGETIKNNVDKAMREFKLRIGKHV